MQGKTVILLTGPTAVGKTAASLAVAEKFQTAIISADSRQCFTELNIAVAKPAPADLSRVHHYFINSNNIQQEVNAALFEQWALGWAAAIFEKKDMVVLTGGTGLYLKAFCEGLDDIPPADMHIREQLMAGYQQNGLSWLQQLIRTEDPLFFSKGELLNPQRVMRALEVVRSTGQSIFSFRNRPRAVRPFQVRKFAIEMPMDLLYARINQRVDDMMAQGLLAEAESLLPFRQLNALHTVGYTELFDYFDGKTDLDTAVASIKTNTRHYAKRQMTWFRKDPLIEWRPASFFDDLRI